MAIAAGGEFRQLGLYAGALTYATAQLTTIQGVINAIQNDAYKQFSVLYAANMEAIVSVSGWATIGDVRTLNARKVTPIAAQDGAGVGAALFVSQSQSITALGLAIGLLSKAKVNESIGNPANFNASDGVELEVPGLANGDLVTDLTLSGLGGLKDDGYLIARKYTPDYAGTFFERVPTAVAFTSDYAFIENNRMVDKFIRRVRSVLIPQLNSVLYLDSSGKLSADTVGYFEDLVNNEIQQMRADGEISDGKAMVDPNQNVLSTSKLVVSAKLLPTGIAEEIEVNIGLVTSL
jgi:hypothetical protein